MHNSAIGDKKWPHIQWGTGGRETIWWHKIEAILGFGGWARVLVLKNIVAFLVLLDYPKPLHRPPVTVTFFGEQFDAFIYDPFIPSFHFIIVFIPQVPCFTRFFSYKTSYQLSKLNISMK